MGRVSLMARATMADYQAELTLHFKGLAVSCTDPLSLFCQCDLASAGHFFDFCLCNLSPLSLVRTTRAAGTDHTSSLPARGAGRGHMGLRCLPQLTTDTLVARPITHCGASGTRSGAWPYFMCLHLPIEFL